MPTPSPATMSKLNRHVFTWVVITICTLAARNDWAQAPAAPARVPFDVQIRPGHSLRSDDGSPYVNGTRGVVSFANYALALCTDGRICGTLPTRQPDTPTERAFVVDLTSPVADSGATNRGVIRASSANMGVFWEQTPDQRRSPDGRENFSIRSVLDMPIGRTVESERAEMRFFIDGVLHILQFGPWTAGIYQNTNQVVYHGKGTTRALLTRNSETVWILKSGPDSVGRLWDDRDATHPVDLGLYRFSFEVQFAAKR